MLDKFCTDARILRVAALDLTMERGATDAMATSAAMSGSLNAGRSGAWMSLRAFEILPLLPIARSTSVARSAGQPVQNRNPQAWENQSVPLGR